jgi:hypothetical protein
MIFRLVYASWMIIVLRHVFLYCSWQIDVVAMYLVECPTLLLYQGVWVIRKVFKSVTIVVLIGLYL